MDLFTAVALSMLPASRSRAASAFKEIRHQSELVCDEALDAVLRTCEMAEPDRPADPDRGPCH